MAEHYYTRKPSSEVCLKEIAADIKRDGALLTFSLWSAGGLFCKDGLDKATRLLIEHAVIKPEWRILDLGCGYGVVGIALKKLFPKLEMVMCDVNERAVAVAQRNVKRHELSIEVFESDVFEGLQGNFDSVLVNPPMAAGRKLCVRMIEDTFSHLNKNGWLQLVARHNKGGEFLSKHMQDVFGNLKTLAKKGGFRVYASQKV